MSTLAPLLTAWDEGHRELSIALGGLSDEDLWRRTHPRLLSVGELVGHVAYWQAVGALGDGSREVDLQQLTIQSSLLDPRFSYYSSSIGEEVHLNMGTSETLFELTRIHEAAKTVAATKEIEDTYPGQWQTWGNFVQYQVFHVAYHAGQVYSVRHLLGHETEDN